MIRILLAEDDELLRETLRIALEKAGYDVVPASNGVAALNLLRQTEFNVIVTDVLMPEMDGLEVIQSLRKASSDVPIVAISGGGRTRNMDMLEYAREFGADRILPKPLLPRDLIAAVKEVLARKT